MDDDNLINAILAASPEVRALYATLRRRGHGVKKAAELALGIGIMTRRDAENAASRIAHEDAAQKITHLAESPPRARAERWRA